MSLRAAIYHQRPRAASRRKLLPQLVRHQSTFGPHVSTHGASYHWDSPAPTPAQLQRAVDFYQSSPPVLLFSSTTFRNVHVSSLPEVAFFGRSNVGKSSLLNALMGKEICRTSSKPGRTRSMNFFAVGGEDEQGNKGRLALLDMPGYGKGSHVEWGREIEKYLSGRKALKRAFLLIDALHGLKSSDDQVLELFRKLGVPHQVVLSKADRVLFPKTTSLTQEKVRAALKQNEPLLAEMVQDLRKKLQPGLGDGPEALGEVIMCSTHKNLQKKKFGIDQVRWATMAATGLGEEKKWSTDFMMQPPLGLDQPTKIVSQEDLLVKDQV